MNTQYVYGGFVMARVFAVGCSQLLGYYLVQTPFYVGSCIAWGRVHYSSFLLCIR